MKRRKVYSLLINILMYASVALVTILVVLLVVYVIGKGVPNITWQFISTKPSKLNGTIGILPDILNTVYIILLSLVFILPLGVGSAVYLSEYAENRRFVKVIEYAAEILSGIPSIIYGLLGMLFFQIISVQVFYQEHLPLRL